MPGRFTPIADPRPIDEPWPPMRWPIPAGTELAGATVRLTPADPARDAQGLFGALDHDAVWAHVPGRPGSPQQCEDQLTQRCARTDWQPWIVRTVRPVAGVPAGSVVGTSSYVSVSSHDAQLEIGHTCYTPAVWATTVNPETKLLLLQHAFDVLQVARVQLKTDVRNHRSQQAVARLGARYEGTLRRHFRRADGSIRDSVMFSVTADDWPAVRTRLTERLAPAPRT